MSSLFTADFLSPYGLQKLEGARRRKDWGEYVGRFLVLVYLLEARPHYCFGNPVFKWPDGNLRSPRAELVRACLEWCRVILMRDKEYVLATRVLLSVALPHARRLAIIRNNPTPLDVEKLLTECLCQLQLKAFFRWEEKCTDEMGPRLLEWAIRNLKFLRQDTEYIEALQFLYLDDGVTSVRQAQLREARTRFIKHGDTKRSERASRLLLPNSDQEGKFNHSQVKVDPLSACARFSYLHEPYAPIELLEFYSNFIKK
jgi:hypothetical protein